MNAKSPPAFEFKPGKNDSWTVYINDRALYSRVAPQKEAKRSLEKQDPPYLFTSYFPIYKLLFCLENNYDFIWLTTSEDFLAQEQVLRQFLELDHKQLPFWKPDDFNLMKLEDFVQQQGFSRSWNLHSEQNSRKDIDSEARSVLEAIKYKQSASKNTETYFETRWERNRRQNAEHPHLKSVLQLKEILSKQALYFIASGPFPEKKLLQIKNERNKTVIAVPGTRRLCQSLGLTPDFLFSTDGGFANSRHFSTEATPLIAPLSVHPLCTRHAPKFYSWLDAKSQDKKINQRIRELELPFMDMQSNVSNTLVLLLNNLGINRINILGADFTMRPFQYHCRGNSAEEWCFRHDDRFSSVDKFYSRYYPPLQEIAKGKYSEKKMDLYKKEREQVLSQVQTSLHYL